MVPLLVTPDDADGKLLAKNLEIDAAHFASPNCHTLGQLARSALFSVVRERLRVIHSHGFTSALIGAPGSFALGCRHIVTAHDLVTEGLLKKIGPNKARLLGAVMRQAHIVHAVGVDCAESLRRLPYMRNTTNIVTIPNGIDSSQFLNSTGHAMIELDALAPDAFLVGFFGRFMSQKGFRILIDAIHLISKTEPRRKILVVAVGSGGFIREERAYIESLGIAQCFQFLGFTENPAQLMSRMDVIAMPSKWEAYGLVAAEVMALGVPLIASDCEGLREVTADTPAIVFPSQDATALAQCIRLEMEHPTKQAAKAFSNAARTRFDFTSNARKIQKMLWEANQ